MSAPIDWSKYLDNEYCYNAKVVSLYDGDTYRCDINLGFGVVLQKQKIRAFAVNTPERRGETKEQGLAVRDFVQENILNKDVKLYSIKDKTGKYGRWLGIILYKKEGSDEYTNLNQELLETNRAVRFMV
jgi:micrococcal nuclease